MNAVYPKSGETIRVLSVRQPFAWAIMAGLKRIENRTWGTPYRGRIWIHAAARAAPASWISPRIAELLPEDWRRTLPRGVLLGSVELVDVVGAELCGDDPWATGPVCWKLRDPRPLAEPVPMLGRVGLFRVRNGECKARRGL